MDSDTSSMVMQIDQGEEIALGEDGIVRIQAVKRSGRALVLRIIAPRDMPVQKSYKDAVMPYPMREVG